MSFQLTNKHITSYQTRGYTIFEQIIPQSLLNDLRSSADKGRLIAHEVKGQQVQRLQPIAEYDMDLLPFRNLYSLPELSAAIHHLLSKDHFCGASKEDPVMGTGILYEPAVQSYCTNWHRDFRDNYRGLDINAWQQDQKNIRLFNQINCALYEDSSLWVIPRSHSRRDRRSEAERFPNRPIEAPELDSSKNDSERQHRCLNYCRSLSGAVQTHLRPGDFMVYRNTLWHLGNYTPNNRRATIHDFLSTTTYVEWMKNPPMTGTDTWMNPNP